MKHRIGEPNTECRYPVHVAAGFIGEVFRWHGDWFAVEAGTGEETRHKGSRKDPGKEKAAAYLATRAGSGLITPTAAPPVKDPQALAEPPLLHPRMKDNDEARDAARAAIAFIGARGWTPISGYPGSDNPWLVRCRCGTDVMRYWSHLRGRNGAEPSAHRHDGCTARDQATAPKTP
ncbi:hypothetical protein [Streptomyces sp. NBC_00134]|uniref:hypothetical protein n=1 Tax=Streptomyces sp. NBC_00134 TaxID=2975663 RepID=UPI002F912F56